MFDDITRRTEKRVEREMGGACSVDNTGTETSSLGLSGVYTFQVRHGLDRIHKISHMVSCVYASLPSVFT